MNWRNDRAIFLQVIDLFKSNIITGILQPGDKISSVREYATELGVNPNTVVKVYDILAKEGLIEARSTNGYFLSTDKKKLATLKPIVAKQYCDEFIQNMRKINFSLEDAIALIKESDVL